MNLLLLAFAFFSSSVLAIDPNSTSNIRARLHQSTTDHLDPKTEGEISQVKLKGYPLRFPHLVPEQSRYLFVEPNAQHLTYIKAAKEGIIPWKEVYQLAFDGGERHKGAILNIRIMASLGDEVIHDQIVSNNFLPFLVHDLTVADNHYLLLDALWAIANLASSNSKNAESIVKAGAIKPLKKLLESENNNVREIAAIALGNLMGNSENAVHACHDAAVVSNLIKMAVKVLKEDPNNVQTMKEATRALYHAVEKAPREYYDNDATEFIDLIFELLKYDDFEVVSNAGWTLMAHRNPNKINSKATPRVLANLKSKNPYISFPSLAVLGTIAHTDEAARLFTLEVLKDVKKLYEYDYWQVSAAVLGFYQKFMLAENDKEYRRKLSYDAGILDIALENLNHEDTLVQETALFTLSHLINTKDTEIFETLVQTPLFLENITKCLHYEISDKYTNQVLATYLLTIMRLEDSQNSMLKYFYKNGVVERLRRVHEESGDKEVKWLSHVVAELIKEGNDKPSNVVLTLPNHVIQTLREIRREKEMQEQGQYQHEEL